MLKVKTIILMFIFKYSGKIVNKLSQSTSIRITKYKKNIYVGTRASLSVMNLNINWYLCDPLQFWSIASSTCNRLPGIYQNYLKVKQKHEYDSPKLKLLREKIHSRLDLQITCNCYIFFLKDSTNLDPI